MSIFTFTIEQKSLHMLRKIYFQYCDLIDSDGIQLNRNVFENKNCYATYTS